MDDFSSMRLGKKAAFFHPFAPKFAHLIHPMTSAPLPPAPEVVDYTSRVKTWPMFDNDRLGDCTVAAIGHLIQLYTSYTKPSAAIMTDQEIISTYSAVSGYDPNNPATDCGAVEHTVLNYWMNHGVPVGGHLDKIAGFARVNPLNDNELKYAIWWFGGLYIGVGLPLAWQRTRDWMMPANTSGENAPGSWGGHAIPIVGYNPEYLTIISWGEIVKMDWKAYHTYCDEAWAVMSADFLNQQGMTPANFDWPHLLAGMQHIREGIAA